MSRNELLNKYAVDRTPCEKWARVMGYLRNLNSFNDGKQSEWKQRVWYDEKEAIAHQI